MAVSEISPVGRSVGSERASSSGHDASLISGGLPPRWAMLVACLLAILSMLYMAYFVGDQRNQPPVDSTWYRDMAAGHPAIKPFANRVLTPFTAHAMGRLLGSTDDTGFFLLGLISIGVAVYGILLPVLQRRQTLGFVAAIVGMYFWKASFVDYFLPDLFHAALLVIFFSFLQRRWWVAASLMFLPLYLARESTVLLSLIAVPILWRFVGRRTGLLFLAASLAGIGASKLATRHALSNIHGINDTLYMVGKIPWNFSKNVLGFSLWTNSDGPPVPARLWDLPPWIHLGSIHQVGYGSPNINNTAGTLLCLLLAFGLGPCVVVCLLRRISMQRLLPRAEPYLCVAALYGAVSYLLSPVLGASIFRLVGYGWPLFLLYVPAIMPRIWAKWRPWQVLYLLAAHLAPYWLWRDKIIVNLWLILLLVVVTEVAGYFLLIRSPETAFSSEVLVAPN